MSMVLAARIVRREPCRATMSLWRGGPCQPQGKYPISTSRFTVYEDGRVLSTTRDDVEGTEFRERSRYHLRNVTIEQSKIHIHQQGW